MKEDGGSAFPVGFASSYISGMTLRDYFAAKAMQSLIAGCMAQGGHIMKHTPEGQLVVPGRQGIPPLAYEYADAMLEARK
jgi:hypothetical protein